MADRYIPEHRRTQFKAKNQFKPDELRRRQKREENLAKRRGIQTSDGGIIGGQVGVDSDEEEGGTIEGEVSRLFLPYQPSSCRLMQYEMRFSRSAGRYLFGAFCFGYYPQTSRQFPMKSSN